MRGFILSLIILAGSVLQVHAQDISVSEEKFVYGIENVSTLDQIYALEKNMHAIEFIGELKFDIKLDVGTARADENCGKAAHTGSLGTINFT